MSIITFASLFIYKELNIMVDSSNDMISVLTQHLQANTRAKDTAMLQNVGNEAAQTQIAAEAKRKEAGIRQAFELTFGTITTWLGIGNSALQIGRG